MKFITTIFTAFILVSSLTSCSSSLDMKSGIRESIDVFIPDVNETSSAFLGDRMMYQASGTNVDCVTPLTSKSETYGLGTSRVTIKKNKELCADSVGSNKYFSDYQILTSTGYIYEIKKFVIETILPNGSSNLCFAGSKMHCLNFTEYELSRRTKFVVVPNTLQQSLEYMGSDGDIAKFIYSELSDNIARPAFNREFQVDLSKGNTLNFKGAEVQIISATNTMIEYKILKYFN